MDIERLPNEGYVEYAHRLTDVVNDGVMNWQEWSDNLIGLGAYSGETCVKNGRFFKKFLEKCDGDYKNSLEKCDDIDKNSLEKIQLERKKLQDATREYNEKLRQDARHELLSERIVDAVNNLPRLPIIPTEITHDIVERDKVGILAIADAHLGVEIDMRDVIGAPVNIYNKDVFISRLNKLANNVVNDYPALKYDRLIVFDMGDDINGILRMSDLTKIKQGVVDATIMYAEIISEFLSNLQYRLDIPIEYHIIGSNHAQLRLLESKPNFPEEDMGKIVREIIALRLQDRYDIEIKPYTDCDYVDVLGVHILAYHGHSSKDDFQEISFWQNYHRISLDILLMAHLHHSESQSVGYGGYGEQEVIHVPGIIGIDPYSTKCRKIAKAGSKFFMIEDGIGKTFERTYVLN